MKRLWWISLLLGGILACGPTTTGPTTGGALEGVSRDSTSMDTLHSGLTVDSIREAPMHKGPHQDSLDALKQKKTREKGGGN
jgi:hypothetical protein